MTKRIVSGIFILTALGALGVILAGALTSGEQLIVRFLTAVIVAALGLYVVSDLRLQADDDALAGRAGGQKRVGKVDAPPNSTAAFMATVTKKVDPRNHQQTRSEMDGPLQVGENAVPEPATRQERANAEHNLNVDATATAVVSEAVLPPGTTSKDSQEKKVMPVAAGPKKAEKVQPVIPVVKKPTDPRQIPAASAANGADGSIPAGAETVVTSKSELFTSSGHAMAGVGAMASSGSSNGDSHGAEGDSPITSDGSETIHEDFLGSQSIDISDLFVDEGAKANFANGSHSGASNGKQSNGSQSNGSGSNGSANGSNGNGTNGSNGNGSNGSANGTNSHWADGHISGRLSEAKGLDQASFNDVSAPFDPAERVYDLEGLDTSAVTGETEEAATEFEYSDDLNSGEHVWPAAPANSAPEPHPFEKASAAYEAAKRKLEGVEQAEPGLTEVNVFPAGTELESVADDAPLAPIIDLRGITDPGEGDVDVAINAGEVEVIATLIEQGMLATSGPISDREVRTMVYVAFTSNELRKLLLAGGSPDGPNSGLDLGPVELFDERIYAPAPKRLYSGAEAPQPTSQIG